MSIVLDKITTVSVDVITIATGMILAHVALLKFKIMKKAVPQDSSVMWSQYRSMSNDEKTFLGVKSYADYKQRYTNK